MVVLLLLVAACVPAGDIEGAVVPSPSVVEDAADAVDGTLAQPEPISTRCAMDALSSEAATPDPGLLEGVACGVVVVPERRQDPSGPVVELAWVRLSVTTPREEGPFGDPLVVLADGPGDAMTVELLAWATSPLRADREVVLLDARGAGRSFPSLDCGIPPAPGALPLDLVQDCRRELLDLGIDLDAHRTRTMAADLVDVTASLGLERYHLLGIGHGARVALTTLRDRPEGLQSLVLDSPLPPEVDAYGERPANAQAALNRLFDECAQTPACADTFGELREPTDQLVRDLDRPSSGVDVEPGVSGTDLVRAVVAAMRGADGPAAIPAALTLAAEDPAAAMARLQDAAVGGATVPDSPFAEGLLLSSDCADELPLAGDGPDMDGLGPVGLAVAEDVTAVRTACGIWDVAPAGAEAGNPIARDVPTLVLTGEFDPLSPPAWGAAVAARMPRGQVVQVDGAGHRVHDVDNCTVAIVAEFLRRPTRPMNDACATDRVVDFELG